MYIKLKHYTAKNYGNTSLNLKKEIFQNPKLLRKYSHFSKIYTNFPKRLGVESVRKITILQKVSDGNRTVSESDLTITLHITFLKGFFGNFVFEFRTFICIIFYMD